jgi:hypothetical protein
MDELQLENRGCVRFSLRTLLALMLAIAILCAWLSSFLLEEHEVRAHGPYFFVADGEVFKSKLELWFKQHNFRQVTPDYSDPLFRNLGIAREIERGFDYRHYTGTHRGSIPFFVNVGVQPVPQGMSYVRLTWGYRCPVYPWRQMSHSQKAQELFSELEKWCEPYHRDDVRPIPPPAKRPLDTASPLHGQSIAVVGLTSFGAVQPAPKMT